MINNNRFQIQEFKLSRMVKDPAIVIIAKRGSGKSWVTRDLAYHYKNLPGGVVISPTDKMNPFYKKFFPDLYVHYDIKDTIFKNILKRQIIMIEVSKKKRKEGKKVDPSGILIMDDCLSKKKSWAKDDSITEILMNGRHYRLTYILIMQYVLGITPELRSNFDYIFLLKEDSAMTRKKIWVNFASMFPTQNSFDKVMSECTKNFGTMVIDNRRPTDNIQEKVFWFKAKNRKFMFGSSKFIEFHKTYYDKNHARKRQAALIGGNVNDIMAHKRRNDADFGVERI
jgi:hypothetical protein